MVLGPLTGNELGGRSWGKRLDDRLRWIMGIQGLPPPVWQVMVVLIVSATTEGVTRDGVHALRTKTGLDIALIHAAVSDAETIGLINRMSTPRQRWQLMEGLAPQDPLPLFKTALLQRIRYIRGLRDHEYRLLEAAVNVGFSWSDGLLYFTYRQLGTYLPSFDNLKIRRTILHLKKKQRLIEVKQGKRGYAGKRPFVYRLVLDPEPSATLSVEDQGTTDDPQDSYVHLVRAAFIRIMPEGTALWTDEYALAALNAGASHYSALGQWPSARVVQDAADRSADYNARSWGYFVRVLQTTVSDAISMARTGHPSGGALVQQRLPLSLPPAGATEVENVRDIEVRNVPVPDSASEETWNRVLKKLAERLPPSNLGLLDDAVALGARDGTYYVGTGTSASAGLLNGNLGAVVEMVYEEVTGQFAKVQFISVGIIERRKGALNDHDDGS